MMVEEPTNFSVITHLETTFRSIFKNHECHRVRYLLEGLHTDFKSYIATRICMSGLIKRKNPSYYLKYQKCVQFFSSESPLFIFVLMTLVQQRIGWRTNNNIIIISRYEYNHQTCSKTTTVYLLTSRFKITTLFINQVLSKQYLRHKLETRSAILN